MGRSSPRGRGGYEPAYEFVSRAIVDDDGKTVQLLNVRDHIFPAIDELEVNFIDQTCDLTELTNLWVFAGYFSKFRGMAHTELCFEFADNRNLVASFEVRTLHGQRYSPIVGFGKNFEMTIAWQTERSALLRRFYRTKINTKVHMFEAAITQQRVVQLFVAAARRTNDLDDEPEWYHTTRSTCATNMLDLVNDILPGHLRKTPRVFLPGYLPKFWAQHGVIKLNGSFDETMAMNNITERCRDIGYVDDFSSQLHRRSGD